MPAAESLPLAAAKRLHVTVAEVGAAPTRESRSEEKRGCGDQHATHVVGIGHWVAHRSLERGKPAERAAAGRPGRAARLELARSDDGHRLSRTARRRGGRGGAARSVRELYPICRSITGDGVRARSRYRRESRSRSTRCRPERRCSTGRFRRSGTSADAHGRTRAARASSTSRLEPARAQLQRARAAHAAARRAEAHSSPCPTTGPDPLPRPPTTHGDWGFCCRTESARRCPTTSTRCFIDSALEPGSLTYGECVHTGRDAEEVLVSCHVCHPSLANDNLSGIALADACSAAHLARLPTALLVSVPVRPRARSASIVWLARERGERRAHQARPRPRRASATGARPTSGAAAAMRRSIAPWRTCCALGIAQPEVRRIQPVRLRRAPVLLTRLRPARRAC